MAAKKTAGRAAALEAIEAERVTVFRRAPVSRRCSEFVRREVADQLPRICELLLNKALEGDVAALKVLWQMAGLDKADAAGGVGAKEMGFARKALKAFRASREAAGG